jgi:hypothetical protein
MVIHNYRMVDAIILIVLIIIISIGYIEVEYEEPDLSQWRNIQDIRILK